ncbi:MAG: GmrSD restriction endonuclease domain-containing protein, partial [bacterium]
MKNNKIQQTTFWNFLQNRKIEIPIIQRDYAQGRIGREKLREIFLKDLKNALDKNKTLKLDFIYGSFENNSLNPLDGQQRLTTLWLLHWYIAFKARILKENETTFKNFSYETRTSSREFCNKLSELSIEPNNENVVEIIQNQIWFFSEWKQDPTIQAMLTMLGGTSIKDNRANDIIDGFEEVFYGTNNEKYVEYWGKLTDDSQCPIVFYHLDLLEMKLSDDLYIKMNARGKQLTDFENFKADLVGYIKKTENIDVETEAKEKIAHKLDTNWTDIFWKNKSRNHKIDQIYFAFINRLLLNCLITSKENNGDLCTADELEENKLFKYLYGNKGNDSNVEYDGFDIYSLEKPVLETGIAKLKTVLNRFELLKGDINKLFHPNWDDNSGFSFIPEYEEKDDKYIPATLTQPQRVVFYAICCYFENGGYDESNFKKWMRVVWNIVENANIETISAMIGAMRLIDELAPNSHKIYNFLADKNSVIKSKTAKEQMEEEKEKARQIVDNKEFKDIYNKTWEEKIIEAEKYAFFKGAICFLFRVVERQYDWDKFDARFEKAKEYFAEKKVKEDYKKDAILLRSFISYFDDWGMFWGMVYDNSIDSWKNLLTNVKWIKPTNCLLDNDLPDFNNWDSQFSEPNDAKKLVHEDLVKSQLLKVVQTGCKLNWRYERYALYPPRANANWKKYVIGSERNVIFSLLCRETITSD